MGDTTLQLAYWFLIIVLPTALSWWMPLWSRQEVYFSVTVEAGFRDTKPAWRALSRFRQRLIAAVILALLILIAAFATGSDSLIVSSILLPSAGAMISFALARRELSRYSVERIKVREALLAPRKIKLPGGWPAQLGPFVILVSAGALLAARWASIPAEIAVHWSLDGNPDRWAAKSFLTVYSPILTGALSCALLAASAYAIMRWSRQVEPHGHGGKEESRWRHRVMLVLLGTEYLLALLLSWVSLLGNMLASSRTALAITPWLMITAPLALISVSVYLLAHRRRSTATAKPIGDGTDDSCWKWGLFYFNPADSALFVEKRFGLGFTLNFARPAVWILLVAFLGVTLGMATLSP